MTDKVCLEFNWDGRFGKKTLKEIEPFQNVFFGKSQFKKLVIPVI